MHICVLGAGVIGITTAYYLNKAGHRVTVIERNAHAGLETSYANGGQLSYSYVAPLAGPGVVPKIPPWLLKRDSPLRFIRASISTNGAGVSNLWPPAIARKRKSPRCICCASPITAAT